MPLRSGRSVVGILNVESERALPDGAAEALRPLARALAPLAETLRASRTLDLAALARLFVHLGSMREPRDIAALGAASLPKILPVEASHIVVWEDLGTPRELAAWRADDASRPALTLDEIARGAHADRSERRLSGARRERELQGLAVGRVAAAPRQCRRDRRARRPRSRRRLTWTRLLLDTAAVLAAHVAASLDAAFALAARAAERRDGLAHRDPEPPRARGAARLAQLASAQERRVPLSLLVIDCDDFKEINDRAGHEFGDALLREVADVSPARCLRARWPRDSGGTSSSSCFPTPGRTPPRRSAVRSGASWLQGLTDAGFPLRISAGIATYPFDGAKPTSLLRAADQALYAAKNAGKDRVAAFRDLTFACPRFPPPSAPARSRGGAGGGATAQERSSRTPWRR